MEEELLLIPGEELLLILWQLLLQLELWVRGLAGGTSGGEAADGVNRLLSLLELLIMGGAAPPPLFSSLRSINSYSRQRRWGAQI